MKNARPTENETSARTSMANFIKLTPRQKRILGLLVERDISREEADRISGASNSPQIISDLRALGFEIPSERMPHCNTAGDKGRHGVYCLTFADQAKPAEVL